MQKVQEAVQAKREWMNEQMQACSQLAKHSDPPVKCTQIRSKTKVSGHHKSNKPTSCDHQCLPPSSPQDLEKTCNPIVTKPKPKVEPPKDEQPKADGSEGAKEGEEGKKEEGTPAEGEGKMEEDPKPAPEQQQQDQDQAPEDMELD